jgi:hypothetical protein
VKGLNPNDKIEDLYIESPPVRPAHHKLRRLNHYDRRTQIHWTRNPLLSCHVSHGSVGSTMTTTMTSMVSRGQPGTGTPSPPPAAGTAGAAEADCGPSSPKRQRRSAKPSIRAQQSAASERVMAEIDATGALDPNPGWGPGALPRPRQRGGGAAQPSKANGETPTPDGAERRVTHKWIYCDIGQHWRRWGIAKVTGTGPWTCATHPGLCMRINPCEAIVGSRKTRPNSLFEYASDGPKHVKLRAPRSGKGPPQLHEENAALWFGYVAERHRTFQGWLGESGAPPPWTSDPIISKGRMCNVFRFLDRESAWLAANVLEPLRNRPADLIFNVLIFRCYLNWHKSAEIVGVQSVEHYDSEVFERKLVEANETLGKLSSAAYNTGSCNLFPVAEGKGSKVRRFAAMFKALAPMMVRSNPRCCDLHPNPAAPPPQHTSSPLRALLGCSLGGAVMVAVALHPDPVRSCPAAPSRRRRCRSHWWPTSSAHAAPSTHSRRSRVYRGWDRSPAFRLASTSATGARTSTTSPSTLTWAPGRRRCELSRAPRGLSFRPHTHPVPNIRLKWCFNDAPCPPLTSHGASIMCAKQLDCRVGWLIRAIRRWGGGVALCVVISACTAGAVVALQRSGLVHRARRARLSRVRAEHVVRGRFFPNLSFHVAVLAGILPICARAPFTKMRRKPGWGRFARTGLGPREREGLFGNLPRPPRPDPAGMGGASATAPRPALNLMAIENCLCEVRRVGQAGRGGRREGRRQGREERACTTSEIAFRA